VKPHVTKTSTGKYQGRSVLPCGTKRGPSKVKDTPTEAYLWAVNETERLAAQNANQRAAMGLPPVVDTGKVTFAAQGNEWLAGLEARPSTRSVYRTYLNKANEAFGNRSIGTITRADVAQFSVAHSREVSNSYRSNVIGRIRDVLQSAVDAGLLVKNEATTVKVKGKDHHEPRILTDA
jgi:hypothetical protein